MGWKILEVTLKVVVKVFELIIKGLEMLINACEWLNAIVKQKRELKEE